MSDLISRRAAIEALGEKPLDWTEDEYELGLQNQWKYDVDAIKALPPVIPIRPKGHWLSVYTGKPSHLKDGMTAEGVKCSECGEWLTASDEYACNGNYCPNCGADMRGEQDE